VSQSLPVIRGFRTTFVVIGVLYAMMASSALVHGVEFLGDFGVSPELIAEPVLEDFFRWRTLVRMQRVVLDPVPPMSDESTELVLGPHVVLSCAATEGVPMFERCPPVHSVLLGHCRVEIGERVHSSRAVAVPANTPHRVVGFEEPVAGVAYLDPRRYTFDDVQGLATKWREFVPGRDDLRDAYRDALAPSPRQVDPRLLRALDAMESVGATVAEAAAGVDLSISRLTHLMTETLGAPPRTWRAWLRERSRPSALLCGIAGLGSGPSRA